METTTAVKQKVTLTVHTTSGIEFEVNDAVTGKSLSGRVFWCDEDDEDFETMEEDGWTSFRKRIEQKGWDLVEEIWS